MKVNELKPLQSLGSSSVSTSNRSRKRRVNDIQEDSGKIHVSKGKEVVSASNTTSIRPSSTLISTNALRRNAKTIPEDNPVYNCEGTSTGIDDNHDELLVSSESRRTIRTDSTAFPPLAAESKSSFNAKGSPTHVIDLTTPSPISATNNNIGASAVISISPETPLSNQQQLRQSARQADKPPLRFNLPSTSIARPSSQQRKNTNKVSGGSELSLRGRSLATRNNSKAANTHANPAFSPPIVTTRPTATTSIRELGRRAPIISESILRPNVDTMLIDDDDTDDRNILLQEPASQEISDEQFARMLQEQEYSALQPLDQEELQVSARQVLHGYNQSHSNYHRSSTYNQRITETSSSNNARYNINNATRQPQYTQARSVNPPSTSIQFPAQHRHRHPHHRQHLTYQRELNILLNDIMGEFGVATHPGNYAEIEDDYESLLRLSERIGDVKKKGIPQHILQQLPTRLFKSGELNGDDAKCLVCLTDYEDEDKIKTLPCGHQYHLECVDSWLKKNDACPVCRLNVQEAIVN